MPQYNDIPKGATPISGSPAATAQYSDLPPGSTAIGGAQAAPTPPPTGTLSAAPAPSWGTQLVNDLQEGGNRTFVGRGLGLMQGRGDKGYSGLESGVSPGAAQYLGSPEIGAAKMIQGAQEVPQHPGKGLLHVAGGALQAATLPSMFMGGPTANAAADALPELLPTRAKAGRLFEGVMNAAKDQPVNLTRSMAPLERTQQLAMRGAPAVGAADKLYQRANTVNPITYGEARDFASNLSGLSASEKMALNPQMHRSVGQLSRSLNADIGDAAASVGRGEDYQQAMNMYRRASRNGELLKWGTQKLLPKAAAGLGGAAAYEVGKKLLK